MCGARRRKVHAAFRGERPGIVWGQPANAAESATPGVAEGCDSLHVLTPTKPGDGGPEMRLRRIPEFDDQRMSFERLLDDAALYASASSVDQADLAQAEIRGGGHVLFDHRRDVARGEGVEVEGVFDRNSSRHCAV